MEKRRKFEESRSLRGRKKVLTKPGAPRPGSGALAGPAAAGESAPRRGERRVRPGPGREPPPRASPSPLGSPPHPVPPAQLPEPSRPRPMGPSGGRGGGLENRNSFTSGRRLTLWFLTRTLPCPKIWNSLPHLQETARNRPPPPSRSWGKERGHIPPFKKETYI